MKKYTARDLMRDGFSEALKAVAAGEDVYIVAGRGRGEGQISTRAIAMYGEEVARKRFKIVLDGEDIESEFGYRGKYQMISGQLVQVGFSAPVDEHDGPWNPVQLLVDGKVVGGFYSNHHKDGVSAMVGVHQKGGSDVAMIPRKDVTFIDEEE